MSTGAITAYVPFSIDTARALEAEAARSGYNKAQIIDFAVRAWALIQTHQATGGKVFLQMADGTMHEVVFEPGS